MTSRVFNLRILAAGAALASLSLPASAAPQNLSIRLTDGAGSITVADNIVSPPAGDTDGAANSLDFDSSTGPALPGGSHASVQATASNTPFLAALSASIEWDNFSLPGETLTLEVSATDYVLSGLDWEGFHGLGGTTPATVTLEAFWSDTNTLFDAKYSIGGPFTYTDPTVPPSFPPYTSFAADLPEIFIAGLNPFSMTTVITIAHGADEPVSSQANSYSALAPVPGPAALPLLATALGLLGLIRARRANA